MVFLFSALAMKAVGSAAQQVVEEVRRQFRDIPGVMKGSTKPEYGVCVDIVAAEAIRCMVKPGLLVVLMPVIVGLVFRMIGAHMGDELLGAKAMMGFLVCSSMSAILL